MHLLPKCLRDELIPAALRLCRPVYYLVKPGVMFGISLAILSSPLGAEGKKCATEDKKKKKGKLPGRLDVEDLLELGISMGTYYTPEQQLLLPNWPS